MPAQDDYFAKAIALLARAQETQRDALETAAQRIAASFAQDGMLYTFGTGHAHLLAEEIFYRAGGMARVCPMLDERLMLHASAHASTAWERTPGLAAQVLARYPVRAGDVLILLSNSGRNAAPVEMAHAARAAGLYTIALTSLRHAQSAAPRNTLGLRLHEAADLTLDNQGEVGDATLTMADGRQVGPTSTVVGAALLQALACRVYALGLASGCPIDFFVSSNVDGGDERNERLIAAYRARVPHL